MMKQLLSLIACLFFVLSSMMVQSSVILNDSTMFIGQQVDSLTEEQRYFNPLYLIMPKDYAQHQSFTLEQWRLLEQSGAIFIPAAGERTAGGVANASFSGGYWCSSWQDESKAHCFHFFSGLIKKSTPNRYHSYSIRLVQDTHYLLSD